MELRTHPRGRLHLMGHLGYRRESREDSLVDVCNGIGGVNGAES